MAILEITVQQKEQNHWPLVLDESRPNTLITHRIQGQFRLDVSALNQLSSPADYGRHLGEALFQGEIGQVIRQKLAQTKAVLHLSLIVEAPDLHPLAWEHLHAPTSDGGWTYLAQGERTQFSLYFVNAENLAPQNQTVGRRALVLRPQIASLPQIQPQVQVQATPPPPKPSPNFSPPPAPTSTTTGPKIENPTVFEITVQPKVGHTWPLVALEQSKQSLLPRRSEGQLRLDVDSLTSLTAEAYGKALGEALFQGDIRDAFIRARDNASGRLRVLLFVEAVDVRALHWERLCTPPKWPFIARDQRTPFCLYLPSVTDRRFQAIGRRDLRALVLVANPQGLDDYGLAPFDAASTATGIQQALGDIPADFLVSGTAHLPTLDALCEAITTTPYSLLHLVAHGRYMKRSGETILYFSTADDTTDPIPVSQLLQRLENLQGARGLPHFAFLATCESAMPEAEAGLGGLAQRLVRELGMPAVVAMTDKVTIKTATELGQKFYQRLRNHGEVDRALVSAMVALAGQSDLMVPALYSRLGARPLFSDNLDRALTKAEIRDGLTRLQGFLDDRAPILRPQFDEQAQKLQGLLGTDVSALSRERQREREALLADLGQLCESILEINFKALALGQDPPPYSAECPFLGLRAFQPEHRQFFFGRDPLIAQLKHRLSEQSFLAVLGASGSGKSSLVMAGLVPELGGQMLYMTPGTAPALGLQRVLSNSPAQAILVIDQFEELFTLTPADKRQGFIDELLGLIQSESQPPLNPPHSGGGVRGGLMPDKLKIILTLRADFLGECAPYTSLAEAIRQNMALVAPMNTEELRRAMEQQAATVGLRFEGGLSHKVLAEVQDEPGAMPLLQHLLQELWKRRHGRWLRHSEYEALGGIKQAIAHTADTLYQQASPAEKPVIRYIFTSLTRLDDDNEQRDTRQRVIFKNLLSNLKDPTINLKTINAQVKKLSSAQARLVITGRTEAGEQTVEVAHEALIRHWPRLRGWLSEDREMLRLRQDIEKAATIWQKRPNDSDLLLHRGGRLAQIEALLEEGRLQNYLSQTAEAYIEACLALRDDELRQAQERAEAMEKALNRANLALARQLSVQAIEQLSNDNSLAWLLAHAAVERRATLETVDSLRRVMAQPGRLAFYLENEASNIGLMRLSQDGRLLATSDGESLRVWEAQTGRLLHTLNDEIRSLQDVRWGGNQSHQHLLAFNWEAVRVWDAETGSVVFTAIIAENTAYVLEPTPLNLATEPEEMRFLFSYEGVYGDIYWVRWHPDGRHILTAHGDLSDETGPHSICLWSVESGERLFSLGDAETNVLSPRWNHDASRLATLSLNFNEDALDSVRIWSAQTGEVLQSLTASGEQEVFVANSWNSDGSRLLTLSIDQAEPHGDRIIRLWDAETGLERFHVAGQAFLWNGDGTRFICLPKDLNDPETPITIRTAERGAAEVNLPKPPDWDDFEAEILLFDEDEVVQPWGLWDAETGQILLISPTKACIWSLDDVFAWNLASSVTPSAWSPDRRYFLVPEESGAIKVMDVKNKDVWLTLNGHSKPPNQLMWSQTGDRIFALEGGLVWVWDMTAWHELPTFSVKPTFLNPQREVVVAEGQKGTACIRAVETGHVSCMLNGLLWENISDVYWNTAGDRVLIAKGAAATAYDAAGGQPLGPAIQVQGGYISQAQWSKNSQRILTVSQKNTVQVWDVEQGGEVISALHLEHGVAALGDSSEAGVSSYELVDLEAVMWNEDETSILSLISYSSHKPSILGVWQAETGQLRHTISAKKFFPSPTGGYLGVVDESAVSIRATESGAVLYQEAVRHLADLSDYMSISWNKRGDKCVIDMATEILLWSAEASQEAQELRSGLDSHATRQVLWDDSGHYVALKTKLSRYPRIYVYSAQTGETIKVLRPSSYDIEMLAWRPDGTQLVTTSEDNPLQLWDIETDDSAPLILQGHLDSLIACQWNISQSLLLSVGRDDTIRVWSLETNEALMTLRPFPFNEPTVEWSADGCRILVYQPYLETVLQYHTDTEPLLSAVRQQLPRPFTAEERAYYLGE